MCNKNCCNHTHHALIFLFILCLLLLLNAQNLNLFHHKSTDSTKSSPSTTAGDGEGGSLSPCTSATTKIAMAFLSGALFTLFLIIVWNNSGLSSPKHNEDHFRARGAHDSGAGPSRMPYMESTDEIDDEVVEGGGVGIGYTLLRTFPTFAYSVRRPLKMGKGSPLCVICQYKFRDGELVRCLPECDHLFHLSCIDKWLTSHKTCPSCRDDLDIIANHGSTSNGITSSIDYYDYFNQYNFHLG